MTQQSSINRETAAVLIMDFQQRIINNFAGEPEAVVKNASAVLAGARNAGIPVIYVVHRGGPFKEYAPDVELHQGVLPAEGDGKRHPDNHGRGHQRLCAFIGALGRRREL